jgi:hypothetical protein
MIDHLIVYHSSCIDGSLMVPVTICCRPVLSQYSTRVSFLLACFAFFVGTAKKYQILHVSSWYQLLFNRTADTSIDPALLV